MPMAGVVVSVGRLQTVKSAVAQTRAAVRARAAVRERNASDLMHTGTFVAASMSRPNLGGSGTRVRPGGSRRLS